MSYTDDHIDLYLDRIDLLRSQLHADPWSRLLKLMAHHSTHVPFETTSLHYSSSRTLSLDLGDLFSKIVVKGRGGYCMELNTFFAAILRGLGYKLFHAAARVKNGETYNGKDHLVNIVMMLDDLWLVDVGFGADSPMCPIRLAPGGQITTISPHQATLSHSRLPEHTDPSQRVWIYSVRDNDKQPWRDQYCFTETEIFPADIAVMNLGPMTLPSSYFVKTVLAARAEMDEDDMGFVMVGVLTLHKNEVKRWRRHTKEVVEILECEEDRVRALDEYFGIKLDFKEQRAIVGTPSELEGSNKRKRQKLDSE